MFRQFNLHRSIVYVSFVSCIFLSNRVSSLNMTGFESFCLILLSSDMTGFDLFYTMNIFLNI